MNALSLTETIPTCATVRSLEAYVLPRFVEIAAPACGTVTSVLLDPRDVVRRGQTVAIVAPLGSDREHGWVAVKSPVDGLVSRCWASAGDVVEPASPILSVACADDVLVVAKFPAGSPVRFGSAVTLLHSGARKRIAATVVRVDEAGNHRGPTRALISLASAPAEVLWPGTPVHVELGW